MRRRTLLAGLGALPATGLAGCLGDGPSDTVSPVDSRTGSPTTGSPGSPGDPSPGSPTDGPNSPTDGPTDSPTPVPTTLRNPSFEDGLAGWTVGRDLPDDPNDPGSPVRSEVGVGDAVAADGEWSLRLLIDGSADDGTVWVQQRVDLPGAGTLSVAGYSETESFNTVAQVAVYAGPDPGRPLEEADFDRSEKTEDHEGWKRYDYQVDHDGVGLVAVGINVVWETTVTRFLDAVALSRTSVRVTAVALAGKYLNIHY